ncbi:MAG TPA: cellulase family glycosylhydrolase [Anaeromyxobacteraceae bacterium]|nr:cellulase family glycosylhydrolase [Anaeromyxobacteraceae bacterium]
MRLAAGVLIFPAVLLACGAGSDGFELGATACEPGPTLAFPGEAGPVVALNAYYLQEEATRALRRGEATSAVVEEVLGEAARLGVRAIRTNGFNDGADKVGDSAIQLAPLVYDEVAFRGLDLVLARARAHGLRLVLPLGNHWDAYGGARRYVGWAGLRGAREGDPRFYTEPAVVDHYRAHVAALLDRVNTFDGIRYGDHPAVLAWELLNEPRGTGLRDGGVAMRRWVDDVAATVKRHAPGHLVATGEEGFEAAGSSFERNTASRWVDVASVHLYPEPWGVSAEDAAAFGAAWISAHAAVARRLGKPLLVGELGVRRDGSFGLEERRAILRGWLACARLSGAAGAAPWLYVNDARPRSWDPFSFGWLDGTAPEDPRNELVDVVLEAAR